MSYESSNYISCPAIQDSLNAVFNQGDLTNRPYIPPFLSALISDRNKQGVTIQQRLDGKGRKKEVEVTYSPRLCEDSVLDTIATACDSGDPVGELSTTYELDPDVGSSIVRSLTLRDLIDTCKDDQYYVANTIMKMMDVVIRVMNKKSLSEAATLFGVHATTGSSAAVDVVTQNGANLSSDMVDKISYLLKISEFNNNDAWIFGGSFDFNRYYQAVNLACCTDVLNFDLSTYNGQYGPLPVFDKAIETQWGANELGLLLPNALQLITYNEFVGANGIRVLDDATYKQGTLVHPATGIEFDYSAKFDCGRWEFAIGLAHKVVGMPSDMFYGCDELSGTNGFWNFKIVNPS
jgi:hypothetical protein